MEKFLSIRQASEFSSLSQRFVYEIVSAREISSYKIHKRFVIGVEDLDEYIKQNVQEVVDWDEKVKDLGR